MEFYIHNKDDNKLTTAVNLATQFKIGEDNYIIYYNTQVEKSSIDIFIGQISYGNQNLVITKIAVEKQNEFLNIVKDILAGKNPKTEPSDYANIIDTATIILDSVQKIQIPTKSLDTLINYPKKEETENVENNEISNENINTETTQETEVKSDNEIQEKQEDNTIQENNEVSTPETSDIEKEQTNDNNPNIIDTDLSGLDSLINQSDNNKKEKIDKKKTKENKVISTPILVMLILAIIAGVIYFICNYLI